MYTKLGGKLICEITITFKSLMNDYRMEVHDLWKLRTGILTEAILVLVWLVAQFSLFLSIVLKNVIWRNTCLK